MPLMQVQPAVPGVVQDGQPVNMLGGHSGEGMVSELHGKYFTQAYRKNSWTASNAVGSPVAVPLMATNCTPTFGILNPAGNNTAVVPQRINFGWTAGTGIAGCLGYAYISPVGAPVGTANTISTYTAGPTIQMDTCGQRYGGNIIFGISFTIGGAVFTPTLHRWSNNGQGAPITSTATLYNIFEEFDGTVIIPPGVCWFPVASVAIAETFQISLMAYEIPWP